MCLCVCARAQCYAWTMVPELNVLYLCPMNVIVNALIQALSQFDSVQEGARFP